ncbi:hypothetical protein J6590_056468 [Homalodisca vitripennis]|nr:hypothetical protein J6590_056468 [Homalodisca vitripennis]
MIEWAFEKYTSAQNDHSSHEYKSPVSHYKPRSLSPLFDQQCHHSLQCKKANYHAPPCIIEILIQRTKV